MNIPKTKIINSRSPLISFDSQILYVCTKSPQFTMFNIEIKIKKIKEFKIDNKQIKYNK